MEKPRKKPIKIINGARKELARRCGVSTVLVWKALKWDKDTIKQRKVRKMALKEYQEK